MKISLCVICYNEAAVITRCLDSAKDAFDELCLVRSVGAEKHDETVDIASDWCFVNKKEFKFSEYTNKIPGLPHTDNFGAARQQSFDMATGDWCMWLDCDDLLDPETCSKLRKCTEQPGIQVHFCHYAKPDGSTCMRERLMRAGAGRWQHRVHENCVVTGLTMHHPDIFVRHAPPVYDNTRSHARNFALLRMETGMSSRNLFYLHEELYWLVHRGNESLREEAIATGQAVLHLFGGGGIEERYEVYLNLGELDAANAEVWFTQAMRLQPWRREAIASLCQRALHIGHRSAALSWFRLMDALPRPNPIPWTHREVWFGWARNYMRVRVLRCSGQFAQADKEHEENLKDPAYAAGVAKHEGESSKQIPLKLEGARTVIMCPTRDRPERCENMFASFAATRRGNTDLVVYVSDDDPQIEAYRAYANQPRSGDKWNGIYFTFGPRLTIVQVFNKCLEHDAQFYGEVNDDHVYRTEGWDVALTSAIQQHGGWGMAYGRTENLPSACIISANCVRALGYFLPPCFKHQYVDNAIQDLYSSAGLLIHLPEVWIEHCHPAFGKAPMDKTYEVMVSHSADDLKAYETWKREQFQSDLDKLSPGILTRKTAA